MVLKVNKYNNFKNTLKIVLIVLLRLSKLYYRICRKNYIFHYIFILPVKLEDIQELGSRDTYLRIGRGILLSLFTYRSEFSLLHNQNKFFDFVSSNRLINFTRIIINQLCNCCNDKIFMNNAPIISYRQI